MVQRKLSLKLNFNDPVKNFFFCLTRFHDYCFLILLLISFVIFAGLLVVWGSSVNNSGFLHKKLIEFLWTFFPALILVFLCLESIRVLYLLEEKLIFFFKRENKESKELRTVKAIGKQWYWRYEYCSLFNIEEGLKSLQELSYDSFLIGRSRINEGGLRNLETEKPLVIYSNNIYPLKVLSGDTLHSFRVKNLGVKIDAVPGRIKRGLLLSKVKGVFYGQCSEICGAKHRFMPIEIEVLNF